MCQLHQQDEASRAWAPRGHAVEAVAQPPVMDSLLRFLLLLLSTATLHCFSTTMRSGECHRHARTDVSVVFTSSSVMIIHCQCRQRKHTFSLRDENMKLLPVCWPLLRPLAAQGPSAACPCPWVTHSQSLSLCVCFVSIYGCVPSHRRLQDGTAQDQN